MNFANFASILSHGRDAAGAPSSPGAGREPVQAWEVYAWQPDSRSFSVVEEDIPSGYTLDAWRRRAR